MAILTKQLTDRECNHTKPKDKEFNLSDGRGLQLRIRPNGTKSWAFRYSHPISKKTVKITLGTYPELSLSEARKIVNNYRSQISRNIDPIEEKKRIELEHQKQNASILSEVAKAWFERKQKHVTKAHAQRIWRALEVYVFPKLGDVQISLITRKDAIEVLRPLESDGKLSTVKRTCQTLNQIMEYAIDCDLLQANPLTRMINAFEKHKVTHMPSIEPDMLSVFLKRLNECDTLQIKTKCLLLWQLHTMVRPKEAARTRWEDINFRTKTWTIPATEMKRRKEHKVPLTKQAIEILKQMKPISCDCEYVFPSQGNKSKHASTYSANAALKRSLGFKDKLVAHGLRSIASTTLHEKGYDSLVIEACLSHLDQNTTRASYNRSDFFEKRKEIMCWWSEHIEEMMP